MSDNPNERLFREFAREAKLKKREIKADEWQNKIASVGEKVAAKILAEELLNPEDVFNDVLSGGREMILALGNEHKRLTEDLKPANPDFVSKLLIAHLRLEHLLDQILIGNFKNCDNGDILADAKLSFWNKVKLLPANQGYNPQMIPFLLEVNKLRNCFVHNLKYEISSFKSKLFDDLFKKRKVTGDAGKMEAILDYIDKTEWLMVAQTPAYAHKIAEIEKKYPRLSLLFLELSNQAKK